MGNILVRIKRNLASVLQKLKAVLFCLRPVSYEQNRYRWCFYIRSYCLPQDTICIGGVTQMPDTHERCPCPSEIGLYRLLCQFDVLPQMMIAVGIHVDDQAFVGQAWSHSEYISVTSYAVKKVTSFYAQTRKIPYSEKLLREKIFVNFEAICESFLSKLLGCGILSPLKVSHYTVS